MDNRLKAKRRAASWMDPEGALVGVHNCAVDRAARPRRLCAMATWPTRAQLMITTQCVLNDFLLQPVAQGNNQYPRFPF